MQSPSLDGSCPTPERGEHTAGGGDWHRPPIVSRGGHSARVE